MRAVEGVWGGAPVGGGKVPCVARVGGGGKQGSLAGGKLGWMPGLASGAEVGGDRVAPDN
jgi:hypothetical protein